MYYIVYKKDYLSKSGKRWKAGDVRIMKDNQKDTNFDEIVERFENWYDIDFSQGNIKVFVIGEIIVSINELGIDFYDKDFKRLLWFNQKGKEKLLSELGT